MARFHNEGYILYSEDEMMPYGINPRSVLSRYLGSGYLYMQHLKKIISEITGLKEEEVKNRLRKAI